MATHIFFFGIFTPKIREDEPNLTIIFFKWVVQPPTWNPCSCLFLLSLSKSGPLKKHTQKPIWTFGKSFQVPKDGISCCFLYVLVLQQRLSRWRFFSPRWQVFYIQYPMRKCQRLLRRKVPFLPVVFFCCEEKPKLWYSTMMESLPGFTSCNRFFLLNTASQIPKSLTVPSGVGFCLSAACWCWVIMENWRLRVFVSRVKGCSNVHMAVKSLLLVNWHIHAFSWVFEKQSSWITTQCHHDMYIPANNQRCPFLTSR